jgi:hypothetical protein
MAVLSAPGWAAAFMDVLLSARTQLGIASVLAAVVAAAAVKKRRRFMPGAFCMMTSRGRLLIRGAACKGSRDARNHIRTGGFACIARWLVPAQPESREVSRPLERIELWLSALPEG